MEASGIRFYNLRRAGWSDSAGPGRRRRGAGPPRALRGGTLWGAGLTPGPRPPSTATSGLSVDACESEASESGAGKPQVKAWRAPGDFLIWELLRPPTSIRNVATSKLNFRHPPAHLWRKRCSRNSVQGPWPSRSLMHQDGGRAVHSRSRRTGLRDLGHRGA